MLPAGGGLDGSLEQTRLRLRTAFLTFPAMAAILGALLLLTQGGGAPGPDRGPLVSLVVMGLLGTVGAPLMFRLLLGVLPFADREKAPAQPRLATATLISFGIAEGVLTLGFAASILSGWMVPYLVGCALSLVAVASIWPTRARWESVASRVGLAAAPGQSTPPPPL
jgi:hypothetical protein